MSGFKYIVIRAGDYEFPIIFPDKLVHEDVAVAMLRLEPICKLKTPVIASAGFVRMDEISVGASISESLGVGPREGDAALIRHYAINHGINTDPVDLNTLKCSPRLGLPVLGEKRVKPETATGRFTDQTRPISGRKPLTGLAKLKARTGKSRL